ncbi:hypothetical protein SESBI_32711 [Sesbania bispinosa]|nr:hypothetical protein SESBI_32711 [Sesbania bispinosa]
MALLVHSPEMHVAPQIAQNPNPKLSKLYSFKPYTKGKAIGSKRAVKISCEVKDYAVLDLGLDQKLNSYGQFSVPVKRGSRQSKEEEEEKQNYYVNMGYAIRTLREEFPDLFYRELSFDIYRDDIVFKDPLNTFIDLSSVWQPVENVIMVRWTVHGIPRVPWESRGRFDGTSEYKLDREGKIYEHRVDNIALNSPPRFKVLGVEELIQSIGCPSTARPTYFEISSSTERKAPSEAPRDREALPIRAGTQGQVRAASLYGKNLKPLDAQFKSKENKVEGCVSQVWVRAFLDQDKNVVYEADSDSVLTKGLAALLVQGVFGSTRPGDSSADSFVENSNGGHSSEVDNNQGTSSPSPSPSSDVSLSSELVGKHIIELGGRAKRIREKLEKELNPVELQIEDVSYQHAGHAGARGSDGETHFNLKVVSEEFEGKSLVKRHRLIYNLLQEELQSGLHALSIVAKTPSEISEG